MLCYVQIGECRLIFILIVNSLFSLVTRQPFWTVPFCKESLRFCDGEKTVNCSRRMTNVTVFDFYGLMVFCGGRRRQNRKLSLCVCNLVVVMGRE